MWGKVRVNGDNLTRQYPNNKHADRQTGTMREGWTRKSVRSRQLRLVREKGEKRKVYTLHREMFDIYAQDRKLALRHLRIASSLHKGVIVNPLILQYSRIHIRPLNDSIRAWYFPRSPLVSHGWLLCCTRKRGG